MITRYKSRKGFTLVEILIVVIILGILAAIVIPQFTNASQEAKRSSLQSTVQSVRSQIELYKLQHSDELPDLEGSNWAVFTKPTDATHATYETVADVPAGTKAFGPYMQSIPVNGLLELSNVVQGVATDTPDGNAGFVYDYGSGSGTGRFWGVDKKIVDGDPVYSLIGDAAEAEAAAPAAP